MAKSPLRLFRYSGNKARLLKYLRPIPAGVTNVVEPYLGSGAFAINSGLRFVGCESSKEICSLWSYLMVLANEPDGAKKLQALYDLVEQSKAKHKKQDIRELDFTHNGAMMYLKVNVCSAMVGQLSSWSIYPQHKLPVERTLECFPRIKDCILICADASFAVSCVNGSSLVFIDPPYIGTQGNYTDKRPGAYDPQSTIDLINSINDKHKVPMVFTYGEGAAEIFPDYNWEVLKKMKVPRLRGGGTVDRTEYVAYINWP